MSSVEWVETPSLHRNTPPTFRAKLPLGAASVFWVKERHHEGYRVAVGPRTLEKLSADAADGRKRALALAERMARNTLVMLGAPQP